MADSDLKVYRRKLPHWRLRGSMYFVTWRLRCDQGVLAPEEREVVFAALRHFDGERYELPAYVVMDDHVHVLVRPLGDVRLERIVHSWKSYTSHVLRPGSRGLWQQEYFDRIVRDEPELLEKARYILDNPTRRWPEITDYKWVGQHGGPGAPE